MKIVLAVNQPMEISYVSDEYPHVKPTYLNNNIYSYMSSPLTLKRTSHSREVHLSFPRSQPFQTSHMTPTDPNSPTTSIITHENPQISQKTLKSSRRLPQPDPWNLLIKPSMTRTDTLKTTKSLEKSIYLHTKNWRKRGRTSWVKASIQNL